METLAHLPNWATKATRAFFYLYEQDYCLDEILFCPHLSPKKHHVNDKAVDANKCWFKR